MMSANSKMPIILLCCCLERNYSCILVPKITRMVACLTTTVVLDFMFYPCGGSTVRLSFVQLAM